MNQLRTARHAPTAAETSLRSAALIGAPGVMAVGFAILAAPAPSAAQPVELSAPDAVSPESYGLIQTVRELRDGRVVWADPLGQALVVGDLDHATADTLGRIGQGPAEYRQPDAVWPLPGDSTLLVDLGNGRLTVLDSGLSFGAAAPIGQGRPGPGMILALPRATDADGFLYVAGRAAPRPGGGELPDSAPVLRLDRADWSVDTVAMVRTERVVVSTSGAAGAQRVSLSLVPLSGADGWTVDPGGRVGIARVEDYHFEWIGPDGTVTAGSPVEVEPVRIAQAEKEEWARDGARSGGGLSVSMSMDGGGAQMAFRRGGGRPGEAGLDQYEWPERKPPFYNEGLRVDGQGRAWVRRHVEAGEPPLYDVFGPDAAHLGSVRLPADRRLVGFGAGRLYAVYMDEFDLNTLERYALPAL